MPKVSICIPTYNKPIFLKRLLDSIKEQTFIDYEVVITDDTLDNSVKQIVDLYEDLHIRYYKNQISLGSPENWNETIRKAEGEFIKIMHHDDWFIDKHSLKKFIDLTNNGYYDFVFSGSIAKYNDLSSYKHYITDKQFNDLFINPKILLKGNIIGGPSSIFFKKELNLFFDSSLIWLVDIDFYYRIISLKKKSNYTSETLIFCYSDINRISYSCHLNKQIEIPEILYFLEKHKIYNYDIISYLIKRFRTMNIKCIQDIRDCGVNKINTKFKYIFYIKNSFFNKTLKKLNCLFKRIYFKISIKKNSMINPYQKISFSQSGEDIIIQYILHSRNHNSFNYIDVGAHHPYNLNNTYIFYKNDNIGINIEPNPEFFNLLKKEREKDTNLNIGINETDNELEFYFFDTPSLNTFSIEEKNRYISLGHKLIKSQIIKVRNINNIINEYLGKAPDILFIDAEGLDYKIISSYNFDKYAPLIICIETISYDLTGRGIKNNKIIDFILSKGYLLYADTNINSIFVLKSFWQI